MASRLTITAAITTYNQAPFIGATIESVLAQTRPADDIVVVDDGSTDQTPEVVAKYSDVRVIRQQNRGIAGARNRAVREARGELVAFLDGDDIWRANKLQRCADVAARVGRAAVIVHDIDAVSGDLKRVIVGEPVLQLVKRANRDSAPVALDCWSHLIDDNFIWTTSQVMIARDAYLGAGQSNRLFPIGSDYDLYLRLAEREPFVLVPEVLALWRQHDNSASGTGDARAFNWALEKMRVLRAHSVAAEGERAAGLREAVAHQVAGLAKQIYAREAVAGSLTTARRLARMAAVCRDLRSGVLACVVLVPPRVRTKVARITGFRVLESKRSDGDLACS
jgi:glycosyltransferase involved in cell wall biosynthesis